MSMSPSARKSLYLAFGCAVVVRLAIFLFAIYHPILITTDERISPARVNGADMQLNQALAKELFVNPIGYFKPIVDFYSSGQGLDKWVFGPLYPSLLHIFNYRTGHTWPLALTFLAGNIFLAWIWLKWFSKQGMSLGWMVAFSFLPNSNLYMIFLGSDLPGAIFFSLFFVSYFQKEKWRGIIFVQWVIPLIFYLLTRINAIFVVMFVFLDMLYSNKGKEDRPSPWPFAILSGVAIFFGLYYLPYLLHHETVHAHRGFPFYGLYPDQYLQGLFVGLPRWLDFICSQTLFIFAKIFYLFGMRPSYSVGSIPVLLIRWAPGALYLSGLIVCLGKKAPQSILVLLFILPILVTRVGDGALERYLLPIIPILFFYFVRSFEGERKV